MAKNFDVTITCHPDGDLESRNVFHVTGQGLASPPEDET
jgi:hypothetical protein